MKLKSLIVGLVLVLPVSIFARDDGRKDPPSSEEIEQTIAADPSVTVLVCVQSGSITVRGWDKSQIVARSSDAARIELRRADGKSAGPAAKVEVFVVDSSEEEGSNESCQSASDIEINVPRGASVHAQTRDGNVSLVDVASSYVVSQNGDVYVERASISAEVCSIGGNISIKNSVGRINLNSAGGSLEIADVRPANASDSFEAVTVSGDISLERVEHLQLNARTVSGNVNLNGPLAHSGRYEFKTMSGDVTLSMPPDASFQLSAKVSQSGEIITDFPLTLTQESAPATAPAPTAAPSRGAAPTPPTPQSEPPKTAPPAQAAPTVAPVTVVKVGPRVKVVTVDPVIAIAPYKLRRFNAIHGSGDATIYVASFSGTLHLKKSD